MTPFSLKRCHRPTTFNRQSKTLVPHFALYKSRKTRQHNSKVYNKYLKTLSLLHELGADCDKESVCTIHYSELYSITKKFPHNTIEEFINNFF